MTRRFVSGLSVLLLGTQVTSGCSTWHRRKPVTEYQPPTLAYWGHSPHAEVRSNPGDQSIALDLSATAQCRPVEWGGTYDVEERNIAPAVVGGGLLVMVGALLTLVGGGMSIADPDTAPDAMRGLLFGGLGGLGLGVGMIVLSDDADNRRQHLRSPASRWAGDVVPCSDGQAIPPLPAGAMAISLLGPSARGKLRDARFDVPSTVNLSASESASVRAWLRECGQEGVGDLRLSFPLLERAPKLQAPAPLTPKDAATVSARALEHTSVRLTITSAPDVAALAADPLAEMARRCALAAPSGCAAGSAIRCIQAARLATDSESRQTYVAQ